MEWLKMSELIPLGKTIETEDGLCTCWDTSGHKIVNRVKRGECTAPCNWCYFFSCSARYDPDGWEKEMERQSHWDDSQYMGGSGTLNSEEDEAMEKDATWLHEQRFNQAKI